MSMVSEVSRLLLSLIILCVLLTACFDKLEFKRKRNEVENEIDSLSKIEEKNKFKKCP
jgi:hypothetical protein